MTAASSLARNVNSSGFCRLGLTDEVAARRLGISLRTARRMMARIMERLGAHSRFEAGLRAKERRWLSPP